ncbi:CRTAC1 family protein [Vibrio sp. FNV 38]|nr:CRTAC1 family protein [Vibrio sp. FNV 38]
MFQLGQPRKLTLLVSLITGALMFGCQSSDVQSNTISSKDAEMLLPLFTNNNAAIPFDTNSRRKWDNPIIADLDQNGRMDIIVTEHAYHAQIYWNNGDHFSEPQTLITRDTHGIAVADVDHDGLVDVIVSQGGGGGLKPRLPVHIKIHKDRTVENLGEYAHFERSRGRAVKLMDSNQNGRLDMVTSAFPLKHQELGANFFYQQKEDGSFSFNRYLPFARWLGYKMLLTDLTNNNIMDMIFYGGENMVVVLGQENGEYIDGTKAVFGDLTNIGHVSSISAFDYNNNGKLDLLLTRAKHQFYGHTYYDEETQSFSFFARNNPLEYGDLLVKGDLNVTNLQMAYPDYDVFIGQDRKLLEVDAPDRHGQRDFTLTKEQAIGYPEEVGETGVYIGYVGDADQDGHGYWRIGGFTKAPVSAVIDNVIEAPSVPLVPKEEIPVKLLENKGGTFVDSTKMLGIDVPEQTTSALTADFDNSGFTDILIIRDGNQSKEFKQILFRNINGKGFVRDDNHEIMNTDLGSTGGGVEGIDYDLDGDIDVVYANQRGRWHLYKNNTAENGSTNNYLTIDIGQSPEAKASPQNAILRLKACDQEYLRIVGNSSAVFSHSLNTHLHIGLGQCDTVDEAMVIWSNFEQAKLNITEVNQVIRVNK